MIRIFNFLSKAWQSIKNPAHQSPEVNARIPYATDGWDHIPQGQYDYIPKGRYVFGPADSFLLVPKNRYRLVLLPDQESNEHLGAGWITEDNTASGYDKLWGDAERLEAFRAEAGHARDNLTKEIVDHIEQRVTHGASVLDVGCGIGDLLSEICRRKTGLKAHGLDFSAKAVDGAAARFPEGRFIQYVIEKELPYPDHSFDLVLCTDVLEHLEHPKVIVAELVRICRPSGLVCIVVPDGCVDQFFGHYWFWSEETLGAMLKEWGAQVGRLPLTGELIACLSPEPGAAIDHV